MIADRTRDEYQKWDHSKNNELYPEQMPNLRPLPSLPTPHTRSVTGSIIVPNDPRAAPPRRTKREPVIRRNISRNRVISPRIFISETMMMRMTRMVEGIRLRVPLPPLQLQRVWRHLRRQPRPQPLPLPKVQLAQSVSVA